MFRAAKKWGPPFVPSLFVHSRRRLRTAAQQEAVLMRAMGAEKAMVGAVDIGGTKIAVGIVDSSGKVLATRDMPSGIQCSYSDGVTRIIEILRALAIDTGV